MAVVRKVQSKITVKKDEGSPKTEKEGRAQTRSALPFQSTARPKRVCQFCKNKTLPSYWDAASLRRYLNDRGRIVARQRSGCCAKHQRRVSQEVKRARFLALLPFTVKV